MATKTKRTRRAKKKTYVAFILDKSGSMATIRQAAIDAFNQHVDDVRKNSKKNKVEARVSFVTFSSLVDAPTLWDADLDDVRLLTQEDYVPSGGTAMLDAVGDTIAKIAEQEDVKSKKASVLVVVISDGEENSSSRWSYSAIAERIQELQKGENWTFTYAGANQDLSVLSKKLNIPLANFQAFEANTSGMKNATRSRSLSTETYFQNYGSSIGASYSSNNFYSPSGKSGT